MSGVTVGEGLECGEDAPAGGFSFNEDGTCISESKESLTGVGDGVGEVAFSCAGVAYVFFPRFFDVRRRLLLRNARPSFLLWLSTIRRLLEIAVHNYPGLTSGDDVVPLTCNMRSRLYLILRCEPGERAVTGGDIGQRRQCRWLIMPALRYQQRAVVYSPRPEF
jgi:hypothetical protein